MDLNAGHLARRVHGGLMKWTNGTYKESWTARLCQKCRLRRITNQPPLSSVIKSRRLTFFGHLARMDDNAGIYEPPPENWRRPPGRPRTTWIKNIHDDLSSLNLGIHEARDLAVHVTITQL